VRRTEFLQASPRMFDSDILDRLSRVHPGVPPVLFGPAILALFAVGLGGNEVLPSLAWALGGWVLWTLTEYWMHRLVFHFEPEAGIGVRVHWMIHGVHHEHPNDPKRLVMPPSVSIPLALLFWALFTLALGSTAALPFTAGFLTGYLIYDMTHYYLHHSRPRSALGRRLRESHMRHHFEDDTRGFGVSAPFWDRAFGTAPRPRQ